MDSQPTYPSPMVAVLAASGPHPELGGKLQLLSFLAQQHGEEIVLEGSFEEGTATLVKLSGSISSEDRLPSP